MDELLEQFLIEGRDLVAQASADFDRLSREPDNLEAIDSAFRAIHTLKGSVAIFPMGSAERVLHAAEAMLARARKAGIAPDSAAMPALVACLDAVDRWIDQLERRGALDDSAERAAAALIDRLTDNGEVEAEIGSQMPEWVAALVERERRAIDLAGSEFVAFRYAPDRECFFRGEDPLAFVAAVPELISLTALPAEGAWPAPEAIDPFRCFTLFEGLSAAPREAVQEAFRLVAEQIVLHRLDLGALEAQFRETPGPTSQVLRVEATRIDALADRLGELVVATNGVASLAAQAEAHDPRLAAGIRAVQTEIERVTGQLHRGVNAARLVTIGPTLRRLPRLVREISEATGKPVRFTVVGERTEVDKQIADSLFEPLLHLIRNAIDHGIESATVRQAAGKPGNGQLTLAISRDGDAIVVAVSDDGAGIDLVRIRQAAVARGLLAPEAAEHLSDGAAARLIFAPGFSTADAVSELSGRGVGMNAVEKTVESLRGRIDIESERGAGTTFRMRLPANALTTQLLVVEVGAERYGVALDNVLETVRVTADALVPVGGGIACVLRGRTVPVLSLAQLVGAKEAPFRSASLLVTMAGGERIAVRVDGFAERIDALVRPPTGLLASLSGVSGATIMGDGGVLLVLDLPGLAA